MSKKKDRLGTDPFDFSGGEFGDNDINLKERGDDNVKEQIHQKYLPQNNITDYKEEKDSVDKGVTVDDKGQKNGSETTIDCDNRDVAKIIKRRGKMKNNVYEGKNATIKTDCSDTGVLRLSIEGEATIYSVDDIYSRIAVCFNESSAMEIDLSKIKKMDSAGYQLLVLMKIEAERHNKIVNINSCSDEVNRIFNLYGHQLN